MRALRRNRDHYRRGRLVVGWFEAPSRRNGQQVAAFTTGGQQGNRYCDRHFRFRVLVFKCRISTDSLDAMSTLPLSRAALPS